MSITAKKYLEDACSANNEDIVAVVETKSKLQIKHNYTNSN